MDEVRKFIALKANISHFTHSYFKQRKYSENIPLSNEDIWVAIYDSTYGKDWVQIGTSKHHYLGKSYADDCGGYPSWGDFIE